jgi:DNA-binding NtrC family response regulator
MKPRIFIVDDEKDFTEALAERLRLRDFDVTTAFSGEEAVEQVKAYNFDVVILDVAMPGMDGTEALREIKRLKPLIEVIMLTGHATVESAIEGMKVGAFDYLKKPCETEELVDKLSRAYAKKTEHEERIREARVREIIASPRAALRGD